MLKWSKIQFPHIWVLSCSQAWTKNTPSFWACFWINIVFPNQIKNWRKLLLWKCSHHFTTSLVSLILYRQFCTTGLRTKAGFVCLFVFVLFCFVFFSHWFPSGKILIDQSPGTLASPPPIWELSLKKKKKKKSALFQRVNFNPLNPGQFTRRCTVYPGRSAITYQYQYQYRFFGSVNSGNYYISPTSIFIAH